MLARVGIGHDEHQVGVRAQVELAHAQAPQCDHHHLVRRRVGSGRGRRRLGERDPVGGGDHLVGQRRRLFQRGEDGGGFQNALALDAQHLPVEAPHRFGLFQPFAVQLKRLPQLVQQFRVAQQVVRKVEAVLEDIEHAGGQLGVSIQAALQVGAGYALLQEVLEPLDTAAQARSGHRLRQLRRALFQQARQVVRRRLWLPFLFRGLGLRQDGVVHGLLRVHHPIVHFPHSRQVLFQLRLERLSGQHGARAVGRHLAR